jgi:hypothetical protein
MLIGLFYRLCTGLVWMIKGMHSATWFLPCLLFGLSIGFVFGLILVLFRGLSHTNRESRYFARLLRSKNATGSPHRF